MRQFMSLVWLSLVLLCAAPAFAFDFEKSGKEVVLPAETSAISTWVSVPAQKGDTVWEYCDQFLRDKRVIDIISTYQCSETAMSANGFTSWNDFRSIQIGQLVVLPSPQNDGAAIRAQAVPLGDNPMGLASEIRRLAIADDAITARLRTLETAQMSLSERLLLIENIRQNVVATGVDPQVFADAMATINARIDMLPAGVTVDTVTTMIAQTLVTAGMSPGLVQTTVDASLSPIVSRLTALEDQQSRLVDDVAELYKRTSAIDSVVAGKVDRDELTATVNDLVDQKLDSVQAKAMIENPWWWVPIGLAAVALVFGIVALVTKQSKRAAASAAKEAEHSARVVAETTATAFARVEQTAKNASEEASKATKVALALTDQVRDIEAVQALLLTLDGQGRFNCPELSDTRLKELGDDDMLVLEIVCLDNRTRKIHVTKGVGGDGKPRLHFFGLERGHDFVDSISLTALYRHLVKARLENWIVGITAAAKAA